MPIQELSSQIKSLQEELSSLRSAENQIQEKLCKLIGQLDDELNQNSHYSKSDDNNTSSAAEIGDLPQMLRRFEAEHPELTASVNRVLVTLGNMGI